MSTVQLRSVCKRIDCYGVLECSVSGCLSVSISEILSTFSSIKSKTQNRLRLGGKLHQPYGCLLAQYSTLDLAVNCNSIVNTSAKCNDDPPSLYSCVTRTLQQDVFSMRYTLFFHRPSSPTGFTMIMLHVLAERSREGWLLHVFIIKMFVHCTDAPELNSEGRVNRGGLLRRPVLLFQPH